MKVAVINDTGGRGHHGCDLVMHELHAGLSRAGVQVAWSHPVGKDWRPKAQELLARERVAAVVVNGEGSIHHSASRPRAVYLAEFARFAKEQMRVPVYLVNSTVTEIDTHVAGELKNYDKIFVRDYGTQSELAGYGLASVVVPDLTAGAELLGGSERAGICVIDSVVEGAKEVLLSISERNGWEHRSLHEKSPKSSASTLAFREFARFLSSHRLVVTGRYHAATMCLATDTPFVAVESNTPKISWLLNDVFGSRRRLIDPSKLNDFDTDEFATWLPDEREALGRFRDRARTRSAAMFQEIGGQDASKKEGQPTNSPARFSLSHLNDWCRGLIKRTA